MILVILLALLALCGTVATVASVRRDGQRRIPTDWTRVAEYGDPF